MKRGAAENVVEITILPLLDFTFLKSSTIITLQQARNGLFKRYELKFLEFNSSSFYLQLDHTVSVDRKVLKGSNGPLQ